MAPRTVSVHDRNFITEHLPMLGGKVLTSTAHNATHFIVCVESAATNEDARLRLLKDLKPRAAAMPNAVMVKSSWLRKSLVAKRLLPYGDADVVTLDSLAGTPALAAPEPAPLPAPVAQPSRRPSRANWACQPHLRDSSQPADDRFRDSTQAVSSIFFEVSELYKVIGMQGTQDYYKGRAFNFASRQIRKLKFPLTNLDDAERARDVMGWSVTNSRYKLLVEILGEEERCAELEAKGCRGVQRQEPARLEMLRANTLIAGTRELRGAAA
jgi:hypothetical protein